MLLVTLPCALDLHENIPRYLTITRTIVYRDKRLGIFRRVKMKDERKDEKILP